MTAPTDEDAAMTAVAPTRRTSRLIGLAGACALAVLALSGCLKLDADLTVNADATGSGMLAIEFQKEAAGFLGISDLASFEKNFSGGDLGAEGLDKFTDCTSSETDAAYVYTCTFENEAFAEGDGPWTITKEGDLVVLRVVNEGQSGNPDDSLDLLGGADLGSLTVAATFPGPITAVSGDGVEKTSDTTATISGSLTDSIDASVTSESSSGGFSVSALLVILGALAVLALIVIVAVVLLMRRRAASSTGEAGAADATPMPDPTAAATIAGSALVGAGAAGEAASGEVVETADETSTDVIETVDETSTDVIETVAETDIVEAETVETDVIETVTEADVVEATEPATDAATDPEPPSA
jgi:hypothetical protein